MTYLLGTDTEQIGFDGARVRYTPHGQLHAVDFEGGNGNTRGAVLGYALCGQAVRAWSGRDFDSTPRDAHPACVALTQQATNQRRGATATAVRRAR